MGARRLKRIKVYKRQLVHPTAPSDWGPNWDLEHGRKVVKSKQAKKEKKKLNQKLFKEQQ